MINVSIALISNSESQGQLSQGNERDLVFGKAKSRAYG
jgi:hypothetical protein